MTLRKRTEVFLVSTALAVVWFGLPPEALGQDKKVHPKFAQDELALEISVKRAHEPKILSTPGVLGMGVGERDGRPAIIIIVDENGTVPIVPKKLDGVRVVIEKGQPPRLVNGGGGCGVFPEGCHDDELPYPVKMGTSTSSSATCDAGTLGFKACDPLTTTLGYVSNNHVAASVPAGGNPNCFNGQPGIVQLHPGTFEDPGCSTLFSKDVGVLNRIVPLVESPSVNKVDAAFVESDDGLTSAEILDIGIPSSAPGTPLLNGCVMKSGRTTGLTHGRINLVDYTWNLNDACATNTMVFEESFRVAPDASCGICTHSPCPFIDFGDSGSAVLDSQNRIVGLAFATEGGGTGIASRIDNVLNELGLTLDLNQCINGVAIIFEDLFEGSDLSTWDGQYVPGAGGLQTSYAAALTGLRGLQVDLSGTAHAFLVDETANIENHYNASFLLDPNSLTMAEGEGMALLAGLEWRAPYALQLRMRRSNGEYQLTLDAWEDEGQSASIPSWVPIRDDENAIRIEWWAANEPGDDDGGIRLWLDGQLAGERTGLDNDERVVSRVRFGAVGVQSGTSGTFYLDELRSWQGERSRAVIAGENFEDGVLPWPTWIPNGGSIEVSTEAKIAGLYGMKVDLVAGSTWVFAADDSPQAESRFETFFRFDPRSLPSQPGTIHVFFVAVDLNSTGWTAILRLRRSWSGETLEMQAIPFFDDGTHSATPWTTISDQAHRLRLQWQAASGSANGFLRFWIDGQLAGELTGLANSQKRVDGAWLGDSGGADEGTVGYFVYDDFRAWR